MKKTTSRFVLALSFISFLFYLIPDDSAEASSAPPISDVTILGPGTWDRDGVGEGDSSLWPGYLYMAVQVMGFLLNRSSDLARCHRIQGLLSLKQQIRSDSGKACL